MMTLNAKQLFPELENMETLQHQMVTKKDLLHFGNLLLEQLKRSDNPKDEKPQWLKSSEVRKLLKISPGTLQNLRINGTLKPNRIGGILYYKYDDIIKILIVEIFQLVINYCCISKKTILILKL